MADFRLSQAFPGPGSLRVTIEPAMVGGTLEEPDMHELHGMEDIEEMSESNNAQAAPDVPPGFEHVSSHSSSGMLTMTASI